MSYRFKINNITLELNDVTRESFDETIKDTFLNMFLTKENIEEIWTQIEAKLLSGDFENI